MKILIFGGAGFLGANLTRRCLLEPDSKITVVDSLDPLFQSSTNSLQEIWNKIDFIRGDIRDESLLSQVVRGQDVIFNCAAQSSHTISLQNPVLDSEINCLGNLKLLEAIARYNEKVRFVYPSSSTVIGRSNEDIADEDHPQNPLEIYSANKGLAEKHCQIFYSQHGIKSTVLRFANLYGAFGKSSPEFGFINHFIHLAQNNQTIKVFGAGDQIRNVMHVEDAAEILWRAAQFSELDGKILFSTSPYHLSVREIAETIVRVWGRGDIQHIKWPQDRQQIEVGDARFSSEKLRALTGWQARYDFVSGLERTKTTLEHLAEEVKA